MNLIQLQKNVESAVEECKAKGVNPEKVKVSIWVELGSEFCKADSTAIYPDAKLFRVIGEGV